jgi:hypothetical protein
MLTVKGRMAKENMQADNKTIQASLKLFNFDGVDMVVEDKK